MMESLLIANRGEIARRIIRTAKMLGIRTIAVYSEADAGLPFVREADEAIAIGPPPARESYLSQERILEAAQKTGAAAIHPGYGFLSENAEFAEAVEKAGIIWVGAPPAAIRAMGLKDAAKELMRAAGVPVTPGYLGPDQSEERLASGAEATGYPVLIKAVAGGGGKGMRRVDRPEDFAEFLASCRREAAASFGDDRVLIERYISNPRHIEVQVFADTFGNCVHLFERDCSLQRRHQKVIEEAPAPGLDAATRAAICDASVKAAKAVNYVGAGTIEFIADASEGLRPDRIWFMEMNTRLQVEHPVTEAITGEDLVLWQLKVASGEPLPKMQDEIAMNGGAFEARLYAENPAAGYLPSIGRLEHLSLPESVRVDSGVEQGDDITAFYDPMIAKIIAHGPNREAALSKLAAACAGIEVWPVKSNAGLLARIAVDPDFRAARIDTGFLDRHGDSLVTTEPSEIAIDTAATVLSRNTDGDPWSALTGFRIAGADDKRVRIRIGDHLLWGQSRPNLAAKTVTIGETTVLFDAGNAWLISLPVASEVEASQGAGDGAILSPMPGLVISVDVAEGDRVAKGDRLLTVEAMKMEHSLRAPFDGIVEKLQVSSGIRVSENQLVVSIVKEQD
ncbi:acetyl/propionyl/methylcrotonyl-CoA carboxylase subunit alpha (plasmid) [Rhizobium leguminosarum]|uniref:Acetyl/propionyl/methylcrotonyl-CoA carboxylase subunit alpha n=1 Tax=Rhizobium leguminosarum TaxID=384 RepID=A0A4Q8XU65_RHILE|nr:acetyl/propionyl/methylcrotonyl-CoA carboxylase subunit alpha [Rhizobium leguminosarum]TAW14330.1 acetyl/propionyl/methylcrotonyl-CoA carboxylase subunit alpha [Rhizobium leguminosarum]TAW32628.1 acetyl/propionyl/methylcrotonyl-CoA carboxylase subunit alpha [Rhizobium leguminosarum]TAX46976.1 acetyl/propionyl/methylcrotonyl-CoA carboxylase subunit alpha [Rhizobium leguminosarum]TAX47559.1 acetyl/propionyl/methylcrotonyl-CoA carboxylase subunit alpha [Rhizobium leguminosarum]TAX67399.1 acety